MPWKGCSLVDQRTEFVLRVLKEDHSFRGLCAEYGISPRVGYKWKQRFLDHGVAGLQDQSRRPLEHPHQLDEDVICKIIELKQNHEHWGPRKIREVYRKNHGTAPSESSFKRILEKAGLVKKRRLRRASSPERISDRVEATKPNDVWTVDFKGWWKTHQGQRCEPLTVRDAASRYILAVVHVADGRTETIRQEFKTLFETHGLPRWIRSDNGRPFACTTAPLGLTKLSSWWVAQNVKLDRIAPGHPEQNGAHERMHRDIRWELQGFARGNPEEIQHHFDVWRHEYNHERPHEGIGMKTPAELYTRSERSFQDIDQIMYPLGFESRRVMSQGQIKYDGCTFPVSKALTGWDLGMKHIERGLIEVWFDYLQLGMIDMDTCAFIRAGQHG